jgi:hypothetical protein
MIKSFCINRKHNSGIHIRDCMKVQDVDTHTKPTEFIHSTDNIFGGQKLDIFTALCNINF